jgi:hypothetical protein
VNFLGKLSKISNLLMLTEEVAIISKQVVNMASAAASQNTLITRSATDVWLIEQQLSVLDVLTCSNCLPTVGLVLRRFNFYDLKTQKLTLSKRCSNVIDEVFSLSFIAHIPTTQKPNAVAKLKTLYERYVNLGKNKARRTDRQMELEAEFSTLMTKLFDVAHANCNKVPSLIKIPEDNAFLEDQRGSRKMAIGQGDKEFKERDEKRQHRQAKEVQRREKALKEAMDVKSSILFNSSEEEALGQDMDTSRSHEDDDPDAVADEQSISKYHRHSTEKCHEPSTTPSSASASHKHLKKRQLVDDPLFVASLDRTKTTPREAMHIVAPALEAAGVDIDTTSLSTSTIYRARKAVRESLVHTQMELFCAKHTTSGSF